MPLNKSVGNMFDWVTHTYNPIKGKCEIDCVYCFMKRDGVKLKPPRLVESELKENLGDNNFIFVGSSIDMFGKEIQNEWIMKVLEYCKKFDNKYLFQTKRPERLYDYENYLPKKSVIGLTLETNRDTSMYSNSLSPIERVNWFNKCITKNKVISIEPIIDFDLNEFVELIKSINPVFVSIGADSQNHNLNEPSKEKIKLLTEELKKFTNVKIKNNLGRIV
jgi:DNA repair photolyase